MKEPVGLANRLWGQNLQNRKLAEVSEELQIVISDLTKLCSGVKILLFGSFAKGLSTVESDLDLAIILPDAVDKKNFKKDFFKVRTRIQLPIDFIFRNETEYQANASDSAIDQEIHETSIELYPKAQEVVHD